MHCFKNLHQRILKGGFPTETSPLKMHQQPTSSPSPCHHYNIIIIMVIFQGEKKREEKAARGHGGGGGAGQTNKIASHTNAFLTSNQVGMVVSMRTNLHTLANLAQWKPKFKFTLKLSQVEIVVAKHIQVNIKQDTFTQILI